MFYVFIRFHVFHSFSLFHFASSSFAVTMSKGQLTCQQGYKRKLMLAAAVAITQNLLGPLQMHHTDRARPTLHGVCGMSLLYTIRWRYKSLEFEGFEVQFSVRRNARKHLAHFSHWHTGPFPVVAWLKNVIPEVTDLCTSNAISGA